MRSWRNWTLFTLTFLFVAVGWFGVLEFKTITDDIPNNTLSGQFTQVSCVDPDGVCESAWAWPIAIGVGALVLGIAATAIWLFYHWYIEPFLSDKRDENGRYFRR